MANVIEILQTVLGFAVIAGLMWLSLRGKKRLEKREGGQSGGTFSVFCGSDSGGCGDGGGGGD